MTFAETRGIDPAVEAEKFSNYHWAKGSLMQDWDAAWRTWITKAVEFNRPRGTGTDGRSLAQANRDRQRAAWRERSAAEQRQAAAQ